MATGYTQNIQNNNKCPHGFPLGACPICSGMGSSSKQDKNKPRVAGEMSYNECLAEWHRIQARKEAKIQEKLDRIEQAQNQLLLNRMMAGLDKISKTLDNFINKMEPMPQLVKIPVKIFINIIIKPILNLISKIPEVIKNVQTSISNFISSVSEKMASVLGEIKNFINSQIEKRFKKPIKLLLSLFSEEEQDKEENEEMEKLKLRELKKVLKGIFRKKQKIKEKENENHHARGI